MNNLTQFAFRFFEYGAVFGSILLLGFILWLVYLYFSDIFQTEHTIRRNYPILGRLRYRFEHLGEFFRQYFFSQDREELPFNRAQRSWAYRAAKNIDSTVAFGSTTPLDKAGSVIFLNSPFPVLKSDYEEPQKLVLGEGFCEKPFRTNKIVNVSAMSFGALSVPAIRALSHGAAKAGIWLNTGEGGLSKYHLEGACDIVFQIGTAKYGVSDEQGRLSDKKLSEIAIVDNVRMFEIKLSQGAKPGKGGILPASKVTTEIAKARGIPEGQDSISPNGHSDIRNIGELLDMIHRVRQVTGKPVGFKAVIGSHDWLRDLCELIHERGHEYAPDFITIDSADGGTGAAPQSLIDYMGLPLKQSLPMAVDILVEYQLRDRIKLICSGKLINPADVAWALAMGADFINTARGFMFSLGCIQALQCNKNTCPTGVTTQDTKFQKGLNPRDKSERVRHFAENLEKEVCVIAHSCGVSEPRKLRRKHASIINDRGYPESMESIHPLPEIRKIEVK